MGRSDTGRQDEESMTWHLSLNSVLHCSDAHRLMHAKSTLREPWRTSSRIHAIHSLGHVWADGLMRYESR